MDSTGFRKLKIAVATGAIAGLLAGAGTALKATAVPAILPFTITTVGATWEFDTKNSGGDFNAFNIDDASLTGPSLGDRQGRRHNDSK